VGGNTLAEDEPGQHMALHQEVVPGGDGGRHLACGLGMLFAERAAKQGLCPTVTNEAPNPGLREDGRGQRVSGNVDRMGLGARRETNLLIGWHPNGWILRDSSLRHAARVGGPEAANVVAGRVH
jgi:hypothetical protein